MSFTSADRPAPSSAKNPKTDEHHASARRVHPALVLAGSGSVALPPVARLPATRQQGIPRSWLKLCASPGMEEEHGVPRKSCRCHFAQVTLAVLADKCVQAAACSECFAVSCSRFVARSDMQENVWDPEMWLKPDSYTQCRRTDVGLGVSLTGAGSPGVRSSFQLVHRR